MGRRNVLLRLASNIKRLAYRLSRAMAVIAAFVLGIMMLLTVADVSGRYFFNSPINGAWEMIGLLLVCGGTWGLAYCQMEKAHISVNVLLLLFPSRLQALVRSLAYLLGLAGFTLICWRALLLTTKYMTERGHITDTLRIPYYPFTIMMAIGTGVLALILLIDLVNSLAEVVRK